METYAALNIASLFPLGYRGNCSVRMIVDSMYLERINLPSLASSKFLGWPHRSSMMRRRSAALRSCSFFNSSAAFLRSSNCLQKRRPLSLMEILIIPFYSPCTYTKFLLSLWCHETLLGLFGSGSFLETLAHLSFFTILFLLLLLSRLLR